MRRVVMVLMVQIQYSSWLQIGGVHGGLFIVILPVPRSPGDPVMVGVEGGHGGSGDPCAARGSGSVPGVVVWLP